MENQRTWQEEIEQNLASLRAVLSEGRSQAAHQVFGEFVREHEWGLALHVVCDYLLEPTVQAAPEAVMQQIQSLHEVMAIEDNCVADLRRKAERAAAP